MQRAVSSLPLSSGCLVKLSSSGFDTVEDLKDIGVVELSREIGVSHSEALEIIRVARGEGKASQLPPPPSTSSTSSTSAQTSSHTSSSTPTPHGREVSLAGQSALDLLRQEQLHGGYIVTFCARVDEMLGGGVPLGKVTEFCGGPGLGKTQISMQLAIDVSIPELLGGIGGEAVYIDTEGSFIVERVVEMASAALQHLNSMVEASKDEAVQQAASLLTLDHILSTIHYYRCHDYLELVATVNLLSEFIARHPKVRLVVIDSIASHFRHGFENMSLRNRILTGLSQTLIKIATSHNVAVVLTNQMTTKASQNSTQLIPALGESWGHASTIRVVLFLAGSERFATLYKSPKQKETTVPFTITADGVRDTPTAPFSQDPSSHDPSSQCISLSTSLMEDDDFCDADRLMADIPDPSTWEGTEGEGGGGGRGGERGTNFISVSELQHDTTAGSVPRTRKRPHPSDHEA